MKQVRQKRFARGRGSKVGQAMYSGKGRSTSRAEAPRPDAGNGLGPREVEVLQCVAKGRSRKQIADALYISPFTVHTHLKNIYAKLDAHNHIEAINAARSLGVIG
mgnify:CR=1 FL=1|jgi:DNA-binding NarL/FixJ family response regulator